MGAKIEAVPALCRASLGWTVEGGCPHVVYVGR